MCSVFFPMNLLFCFIPRALKTPGLWRSRTGKVLQQHLTWVTHGAGLVYHELRELLWGGEFKLLLHWSSWKKMAFPEENELKRL